jgi:hypothetical protein
VPHRSLGIFALAAVILAAISFALVDVSIANANGCIGATRACPDSDMPTSAIVCAIIGTIALLASVRPAIQWFISVIHNQHHDADIEPMRVVVQRHNFEDDDL